MKDYTEDNVIVVGGRWPPGAGYKPVLITNCAGWPDDADTWTWEIVLSRNRRGGVPDLVVEAVYVAITEAEEEPLPAQLLTLGFILDAAGTALLTKGRLYVEIRSFDGADYSYYDVVGGFADVRKPSGEGGTV